MINCVDSPIMASSSQLPDDRYASCSMVAFDDADDKDDAGEASPAPHCDLWFPDGSVILATKDVLFRVHISVLTRHSVFFRDMFSLPQPTALNERNSFVEGCPVVHLHDSSEDLTNLLLAMYDGPKFGNNDTNDFRAVSGILRLAHKYLIESLRTKALEHLSIAWPSTLEDWDKREDLLGEYYVDAEGDRYYPSPVDVINLAHEINAPALFASAFYDLSRYQFSQLLPSTSASSPINPSSPSSISLSPLSLSDTQKLVLGKESSQYAIISLIRSIGTDIYSSSNHPRHNPASPAYPPHMNNITTPLNLRHKRTGSGSCAATCKRDVGELVALATQHYLFDRERGASDPLYVAEELGQLMSTEMEGVECKACARALEMWARRERDRLWRSIPSWFRLEA